MDERTSGFYAANAADLAELYSAPQPEMERLILAAFRPGMRVLDVGAGSGRDVAFLLEMGCDACGVEPCDELRTLALRRYPRLAGRLAFAQIPDLGRPFGGGFDGVLCSGVLSHVPSDRMATAALAIAGVMTSGGTLLLTIPLEPLGTDENHRDRFGRLITPVSPEELESLFEPPGLRLTGRWDFRDPLNREGHSWCGLLFLAGA